MNMPPTARQDDPLSPLANEEGSGTVLILALCAAIILAAGGIALLWAGALTSTRTQNAADMAAYAGASTGSCAPVRTIAERSGMKVLSCTITSGQADVELEAALAWAHFQAHASAQGLTLSMPAKTSAATETSVPARAPPARSEGMHEAVARHLRAR